MKALNLKPRAVLPAIVILLIHASPSPAQSSCKGPEVRLGNTFIQIAPTGSDDTENIQCALDLAVENRIPEIRLTRGDFFISAVSARGFYGSLQGGGRDHTRIRVLGQSVDCEAIEARGEATAAIKFIGGEPRVRWLTLAVDGAILPCATGGGDYGGLDAIIHFSGQRGSPASCTAGVVFGTVDRVNLEGPRSYYTHGPQAIYTGVLVSAEESGNSDCRNSLLGSIRINRSLIGGFAAGAWLNLRGNAKVSVLNTDFDDNHTGLRFDDSNAVVTVFGNRFASKAPASSACCGSGGTGISVFNRMASTGVTHLDVYGNTFLVRGGAFESAWGIRLIRNSDATAVGMMISRNHFQLSGDRDLAAAVSSHGVSGGVLSDNLISGYLQGSGHSLSLSADVIGEADHWTFVANRGLADMYRPEFGAVDIYLGWNSSNTLIGPGQAAIVRDEGVGNIVLPQ
jgi:hypothetical protein